MLRSVALNTVRHIALSKSAFADTPQRGNNIETHLCVHTFDFK